ncbi:MAG: LacI family DNA-binding transcriptional regulator [Spirochaetales bacterium]|nr:LacI family DNA-binding transcriptional regulator [Spirochaetales bacterium]
MTIQDVADEAGVSTATVSRVLNNHAVRAESRRKVEQAVKKLNFVPNALAQGLMQKKTKTIGTLITSMTNSYYMEITDVIEKRLWEKESMLFLCSTDGDRCQEAEYLESLVSRQVEGIIMIDPTIENYDNGQYQAVSEKVPLVLVHSFPEISGINSVIIDQERGMVKVMDYLWNQGHRRISFLRGHHGYSFDIKENSWRAYLESRGSSPLDEDMIVIQGGNTDTAIQDAMDACRKILSGCSRPTAIFACNDLMAIGAMTAARSLNMSIPEDLSIIGHDNTNLTISTYPALTSVDMKLGSLGNAAVDLFDHAASSRDTEPRKVLIEPDLVIRGSSGPCPFNAN